MVKIRLEGTTIELKRIRRIIERNRNYKVVNISDMLPNKGTKKYFRQYVDVKFNVNNKD